MDIKTFSFNILPQRVPALGNQEIAIADLDGDGHFDPKADTTVFLQDENGGGLVNFPDLRSALERVGGQADGQDLAKALDPAREDARVEPAQTPKSLSGPLANGHFSLQGDRIEARYDVLGPVAVIAPADGNIATLDVNHDGVSEPGHDSVLQLQAYDQGRTYTNWISLDELRGAVQAAGGSLSEQQFTAGLRSLSPVGQQAQNISLEESPVQFDTFGYHRTLTCDDQGQLFLTYSK